MATLAQSTRGLDRLLRWLLPAPLRMAARRALFRLANPRKLVPSWLSTDSHVGTLIAETGEGLVAFDVRDEGVGWPIALAGDWERSESDHLRALVRGGDLVVDIGANIGWYSLLLSAKVGDDGLVVAFEPAPRNFELLSHNLKLNGRERRVRAFQLALMARDGDVEFELSDQNFGDHRIRLRAPETWREPELYDEHARRVTKVRARPLDAVLDENGLGARPIRLMKIDCQGVEPAILQGAARALARVEYLAIEYWPYGVRRAGFDPADLIRTLTAGFDAFASLRDTASPPLFRPIAELAAHAANVKDADYLLRRTTAPRT